MWGRKKKARLEHEAEVRSAQAGQRRADAIVRLIESQQPEVDQRVGRLQERARQNHFGEALADSMLRRAT